MKFQAAFLSLACILWTADARTGFLSPNADIGDLDPASAVIQGTTVKIEWGVNSTWQPSVNGRNLLDDNGHVSLWVTSWPSQAWGKCISASVDSTKGGSLSWKVDLSDKEIEGRGGQFAYRLQPVVPSIKTSYVAMDLGVDSRGFRIVKVADVIAAAAQWATPTLSPTPGSTPTPIQLPPYGPTPIGLPPYGPTPIGLPPYGPTPIGLPPYGTPIELPPNSPTPIGLPPYSPTPIQLPPSHNGDQCTGWWKRRHPACHGQSP